MIYNYVSKSSPISPLPFRRKKEHTSFRIINVSFFQSPGKRVNHRVTEIRRRRMPPPPVRSTSFQVSPLPSSKKGRPRVFPTRQPFFLFSSAVWQPLPSSLTNIYTHTHTSLSSRTKVRTWACIGRRPDFFATSQSQQRRRRRRKKAASISIQGGCLPFRRISSRRGYEKGQRCNAFCF